MLPQIVVIFSGKRKSGKDYLTDRLQDIKDRFKKKLGLKKFQLLNATESHTKDNIMKNSCCKFQLNRFSRSGDIMYTVLRKANKRQLSSLFGLGENVCSIIKISEPIKSHWAKSKGLSLEKLLSDGEYKENYRLEMIRWSEEERDKDYGCFCKLACENAKPSNVWIVSDIRRKTDLKWFREMYGSKVTTVKVTADENIRRQRGLVFTPGVDDAPSECDLDNVLQWDHIIENSDSSVSIEEKLSNLLNSILSKIST